MLLDVLKNAFAKISRDLARYTVARRRIRRKDFLDSERRDIDIEEKEEEEKKTNTQGSFFRGSLS